LRMAEYLPLKLVELPFEMPPVRESAQWTSRNATDPAIAWLVERLKQTARQLQSSASAGPI
jgi:LysR family transcriptional regulator, nod-box dependent transcriptional activator